MTDMQSNVLAKGFVRVSKAPEVDTQSIPPVLYMRGGRYYVPEGRDKFAREARPEEILQPADPVLTEGPNHITKGGRIRVAQLAAGLSADFPRRLAVGDAGTAPGTNVPLPPSDLATSLNHEITRVDVSQRIINVDVPSVTFVGLFKTGGSYQFNQPGQAIISEVGLFTTDEVLAAVYNFAPIPVDVHRLGVLVEWEWSVL